MTFSNDLAVVIVAFSLNIDIVGSEASRFFPSIAGRIGSWLVARSSNHRHGRRYDNPPHSIKFSAEPPRHSDDSDGEPDRRPQGFASQS